MSKHLESQLRQRYSCSVQPRKTATQPNPLTVQLWFEVGHGMQASLHIGSNIHRFRDVMALVCYLLELAEEPDGFQATNTG